MIAVKDYDGECFLGPEVVREAALRNARFAGDLANTGGREAALVKRRDTGCDDFFFEGRSCHGQTIQLDDAKPAPSTCRQAQNSVADSTSCALTARTRISPGCSAGGVAVSAVWSLITRCPPGR
ncbi:hypothetical protein ACVJBD_006054 [Rhizobium mongolense]